MKKKTRGGRRSTFAAGIGLVVDMGQTQVSQCYRRAGREEEITTSHIAGSRLEHVSTWRHMCLLSKGSILRDMTRKEKGGTTEGVTPD